MTMTKTCTVCGVTKSLEDFHKDPKGKNGYRACCKPCNIAKVSAWQRANPERARAKSRRWYAKNRARKALEGV